MVPSARGSRRSRPRPCRPAGKGGGDCGQVRRQNTPAHPASQAGFPMFATAVQAKAATPHADPPRDTRSKPESPPKPGGSRLGDPCWRRLPGIRDGEAGDPSVLGRRLVGGSVDPAGSRQPPRGPAEALLMGHETVWQRRAILTGLGQDAVAADEAPVHLLQPDLTAKFHRSPRFPPDAELRLWCKKPDQRIPGRHRCPRHDAPDGLVDHPRHPRQERLERPHQSLGPRARLCPQHRAHLGGVSAGTRGHADQPSIRLLPPCRSRRRTLRLRRWNARGLGTARWPMTDWARRHSRLSTRTPSPSRPRSVG